MTEQGIREAVSEMNEIALDIRMLKHAIKPTAPKETTARLEGAALVLNDIAKELLATSNLELPEGVL